MEAGDREELVAAVKALDRVLLWEYYVVPHWFIPSIRLVYWDKFGMRDTPVMKGVQLMSWWIDPEKQERLQVLKEKEEKREKTHGKTLFQRLKEWF